MDFSKCHCKRFFLPFAKLNHAQKANVSSATGAYELKRQCYIVVHLVTSPKTHEPTYRRTLTKAQNNRSKNVRCKNKVLTCFESAGLELGLS